MNIAFSSGKLARCYENSREAQRAWGQAIAKKYVMRVDTLYKAQNFDELFLLPALRLHPLKGVRSGAFSMTLQGKWRLIITATEDRRSIVVEEVSNHYDD